MAIPMNDNDLLHALRKHPDSLSAPEYLRAIQLHCVEHDDRLKEFCQLESLRGRVNDSLGAQVATPEIGENVVEQHYVFGTRNLVQQLVDDMRRSLENIAPTPAGFMPTLQTGAAVMKTPRGDSVIVVDLGLYILINSLAWWAAPLFRPDRPTACSPLMGPISGDIANAVLYFCSEGRIGKLESIVSSESDPSALLEHSLVADAIAKSMLSFIVAHELLHVAAAVGLSRRLIAALGQFSLLNLLTTAMDDAVPHGEDSFDGTLFLEFLAKAKRDAQETQVVEIGTEGFKTPVEYFKRSQQLEYLTDFLAADLIWNRNRHLFAANVDVEAFEYFSIISPDFVLSLVDLIESTYASLNALDVPLPERSLATHPTSQARKESWRRAPAYCLGGDKPFWGRLKGRPRDDCARFEELLAMASQLVSDHTSTRLACPRCSLKLVEFSPNPAAFEKWRESGNQFPGLQYTCGGCGFCLAAASFCTECQLLTINLWYPEELLELPYCSQCNAKNRVQATEPIPSLLQVLEGRYIDTAE